MTTTIMSETTMPAAEATTTEFDERTSYELAFHVLPTVAEGEVARVFEEIKAHISKTGAEIISSETPERFELAYDIVKSIEGRQRKFKSAYFGWVRFKVMSDEIEHLTEAIDSRVDILRHLLIKLTKTEEAMPFFFHAALDTNKSVHIDIEEALADAEEVTEEVEEIEEVAVDPVEEETSVDKV
jgi:ribosomal protein S6